MYSIGYTQNLRYQRQQKGSLVCQRYSTTTNYTAPTQNISCLYLARKKVHKEEQHTQMATCWQPISKEWRRRLYCLGSRGARAGKDTTKDTSQGYPEKDISLCVKINTMQLQFAMVARVCRSCLGIGAAQVGSSFSDSIG